MALIMTAVKHGATVANYLEVTDLKKNTAGKITGAEVKDALSGEKIAIRAKVCDSAAYNISTSNTNISCRA